MNRYKYVTGLLTLFICFSLVIAGGTKTHRAEAQPIPEKECFHTAAAVGETGKKGPTESSTGENGEEKLSPNEGKVELVIDVDRRILTVYVNDKAYKEYPVAIGKEDTPSPVGDWQIVHKGLDWGGGFGTRWLGLSVPWGIYGIHGTNKPGSISTAASHGCFRMHNDHVEEIYPWVSVGTQVKVVGTIKHLPEHRNRTLRRGMSGTDVVAVQKRLQELQLYWGKADGIFGTLTEISVKYYQALTGLPLTGIVGPETKEILEPEC